ncbi:MAG: UDP-N-acetylglucosamine 2-epimerase (non-hydrolyzing) [Nitrospirae bacterium]|nr:UDP-N-acetylglucosamine 2-epimerase (non-hydrolyzing) [Nitrospirota bacterium]
MRILTIVGTRPDTIKMAPVIKTLEADPFFESRLCVTAQHRRMLDQVIEAFDLHPDHDLDLMSPDQELTELTAKILIGIRDRLRIFRPDLVLVHGDTTTTLAAALACYYQKIPVGHVEAGLRTQNKYAPFPEEINRRLTDTLADLHFCPTERARQNLLREGMSAATLHVTGNTAIDALHWAVAYLDRKPPVERKSCVAGSEGRLPEALYDRIEARPDRRWLIVTGHRRENFGEPLRNICDALRILSKEDAVEIIYPVHLNPNVCDPVFEILSGINNLHLIHPLNYLSFVYLMKKSYLMITDSGGIQEEAPALGKPVLVMRETTERPEAIEAGTARLVGADADRIVTETRRLLNDRNEYERMARTSNPFGDGKAAGRIVRILKERH